MKKENSTRKACTVTRGEFESRVLHLVRRFCFAVREADSADADGEMGSMSDVERQNPNTQVASEGMAGRKRVAGGKGAKAAGLNQVLTTETIRCSVQTEGVDLLLY